MCVRAAGATTAAAALARRAPGIERRGMRADR